MLGGVCSHDLRMGIEMTFPKLHGFATRLTRTAGLLNADEQSHLNSRELLGFPEPSTSALPEGTRTMRPPATELSLRPLELPTCPALFYMPEISS